MTSLQYFHYGQLVHHGEAKGDERILAKTDAISDEFIELAIETAKLPQNLIQLGFHGASCELNAANQW